MPGLLFTCRITQTSNLKSFKLFEELSLRNHCGCMCVCLCLTLIVSTCCCCCCCYFCCSALWQSYLSDTLHSFAIGSRFLSYQATLKCLAQILDSWFLSSLHWECRRQADSLCCGYNTMKALGCSFLGFFVHGCVCVCEVTKTRCVIIITDRQQSWPWVVKQQNSWTVQQFELCVMCCIELISWPGQVSATHTHPHSVGTIVTSILKTHYLWQLFKQVSGTRAAHISK